MHSIFQKLDKLIMNDQNLIEKLRSQKTKEREEGLRILYKNNYQPIENYVLKNNGSPEDAKDIFQEVVIAFYHKVNETDFQLSCKLSTFLFSMSRNQWLKKLRSKKIHNEYISVQKEQELVSENIDYEMEYTEQQIKVANLLKASGERCMKLLHLFYFQRMSMEDIASEFNYSTGQVARNQKVRCLKKIKALLKDQKELSDYWLDVNPSS